MVDGTNDGYQEVRAPTRNDLIEICRRMNESGARYVVLGGMALIEWGLDRGTMDIDFLVDADPANVRLIAKVLEHLPDGASRELRDTDVQEYHVVRINDEFTVDLMESACAINYAEALPLVVVRELDGVKIPFASPLLLWKTKQTHREKDALDRAFLRQLLTEDQLK